MIIQRENNEIERFNTGTESNFSIQVDRTAFKILSEGLYSNKPKAIIQELSSNAYDAHLVAKNENPFDLHLPNRYHPYFYVRDYGTGISPEDILTVYTVYFSSTKRTSETQTGCFGLGAKTPFAYTDNFIVTSFFGGKKYVYSAIINENGIPAISLVSEEKTDEPSGLKVQFAVEEKDFNTFLAEAVKVFRFYKQRPNMLGAEVNFDSYTPIIDKPEYAVYNNVPFTNGILVGPVFYPIPTDKMPKLPLANQVLIFKAGASDVEVTPSRESLSYTQYTTDFIDKRVESFLTDFRIDIEAKIASCTSYFEARAIVRQFKSFGPFNYDGREVTDVLSYEDGVAKGFITTVIGSIRFAQYKHYAYRGNSKHSNHQFFDENNYLRTDVDPTTQTSKAVYINQTKHFDHLRMEPTAKLLYGDIKNKEKKVKKYCKELHCEIVYIDGDTDGSKIKSLLKYIGYDLTKIELHTFDGFEDKFPAVKRNPARDFVYYSVRSDGRIPYPKGEEGGQDLEDGFYVTKTRFAEVKENIKELYTILGWVGEHNKSLVMVADTNAKKLDESMIDIETRVKQILKDKEQELIPALQDDAFHIGYTNYQTNSNLGLYDIVFERSGFKFPKNKMAGIFNLYSKISKYNITVDIEQRKLQDTVNKTERELHAMEKKLLQKYQILNHWKDLRDEVLPFMEMEDKAQKYQELVDKGLIS